MSDPTFTMLASKSAKLYRSPVLSSGKRAAPALKTTLATTPPVPVAQTPAAPGELAYMGDEWETWTSESDVESGDAIAYAPSYSPQYPIVRVERLPFNGATRSRIIYRAPQFAATP